MRNTANQAGSMGRISYWTSRKRIQGTREGVNRRGRLWGSGRNRNTRSLTVKGI